MLGGGGQACVILVDVEVLDRDVAAHHRPHVKVDVLEPVDQPANMIIVGERRMAQPAVDIDDVDGRAAGAHVDPPSPDDDIMIARAPRQHDFVGRRRETLLDEPPGKGHPVGRVVHRAAGLEKHLAAGALHHLDAGTLENRHGGVDDPLDIGVGEGAVPAAGMPPRDDGPGRMAFGGCTGTAAGHGRPPRSVPTLSRMAAPFFGDGSTGESGRRAQLRCGVVDGVSWYGDVGEAARMLTPGPGGARRDPPRVTSNPRRGIPTQVGARQQSTTAVDKSVCNRPGTPLNGTLTLVPDRVAHFLGNSLSH